jgi:beta-lactamase regulating signal transducer with metallopeptidase domain
MIGWFNPLVHLAAAVSRLDQELACDAAVLEGRSSLRRAYAQVLLKVSAGPRGPLACSLSAEGRVLELRLRWIMKSPVTLKRYLSGLVAVGATGALLVGLVWTSAPAEGFGPPAHFPENTPRPIRISVTHGAL